jgi:hypothetical protein
LLPVAPTLDRSFTSDETIQAFVRVVPGRNGSPQPRAAFVLDGRGATLRTPSTSCAPSVMVDGALDCLADIPLNGVTAGDYILAFTAQDDDGGMASRSMPLAIR